MKIELSRYWDNPCHSLAMTAYNLGMLRIAAETESVIYILSKINEIYASAKRKCDNDKTLELKCLIDHVVGNLLRLGSHESDFRGLPTKYGPYGARKDGHIPDIRKIKIERSHLIKALTLIGRL